MARETAVDERLLAAMIAEVPDQGEVYDSDLAHAQIRISARRKLELPEEEDQSTHETAIDGVAYHVFNSLRGRNDDVNGVTFVDVRAIIVETLNA